MSGDRQDVDLSVVAQLWALRDYANGSSVARKYVDEAESGRAAALELAGVEVAVGGRRPHG